MTLKADLRQFLDERGNELALTEQAKAVFKFLTKIVSVTTENIEQSLIDVDLQCNTRPGDLSCEGNIEATCIGVDLIEWHCDTCEAAGTISNWRGSMWDKARTIH